MVPPTSSVLSAICLGLVLLFVGTGEAAAETLVINITGNPPLNTPEQAGFVDRIAAEACRRVGLELQTVNLPAERGLKNANAGIDDGDMLRVKGIERLYPNLVMVPEKVMDWEFTAFSKHKLKLEGKWSNLAPHSVSIIIGWKLLENNVPPATELTLVKNPKQLFSLLEKDRAEVIIYERWGGLMYLREKGLSDSVQPLAPPFAVREMYIYLNKKHTKYVPALAKALRDMKRDGTYQRIYEQTLAPLIKGDG